MSRNLQFTTPVHVAKNESAIYCDSRILTLGSCFSDHIGNKLKRHFFHTDVNPFGTVFNPISIAELLNLVVGNKKMGLEDLNSVGERHFHYDFHTSFDNTEPQVVLENINNTLSLTREALPKTDFLIITFGTSIVYKLKSQDRIVSNCHKVPGFNFEKSFLDIDFMVKGFLRAIDSVKNVNPDIKIVLTVSPVRHTKEGLTENSLSKSRLIGLCHKLTKTVSNSSYFPSYEIMMDELRDYRYYKNDLIHPSDLAVDIIWSRFIDTFFDEKAVQKAEDMQKLLKASEHKPFDPQSEGHKNFKTSQLENIASYEKTYPEVDFRDLIQHFS